METQKLCAVCVDMLNTEPGPDDDSWEDNSKGRAHHLTLKSLHDAALGGCRVCEPLWKAYCAKTEDLNEVFSTFGCITRSYRSWEFIYSDKRNFKYYRLEFFLGRKWNIPLRINLYPQES
jgi:hypothetical protein